MIRIAMLQGCERVLARVGTDSMLGWLLVFPWLISAMVPPASPQNFREALPKEIQVHTFSQLGLGGLYQATRVSRHFRMLAYQALKALYGYEYKGVIYLDYTRMLYEHKEKVNNAERGRTPAEASELLQSSADYLFLDLILRADLAGWIHPAEGNSLNFCLPEMDVSIKDGRILALPYILDHLIARANWIDYIRGLADFGRFDLLERMVFPEIIPWRFDQLMSVCLPLSIVLTAAKSLQKNCPEEDLARLLGFAGFNDPIVQLPMGWEAPLFMLRLLDENGVTIPRDCMFYGGLQEDSISFWMYVLTKDHEKAMELLSLVFKQGDDSTKLLASAWFEPVSENSLDVPYDDYERRLEIALYQAILIRFRHSSLCNPQIIQNYNAAFRKHKSIEYQAARACVDCGQFQLLTLSDTKNSIDFNIEALAVKMYLVEDNAADVFVRECYEELSHAPELLKRLLRKKARDSYMQLVWEAIHSKYWNRSLNEDFCGAPLQVLKRLSFEQSISANAIEELLSPAYEESTKLQEEIPIVVYFLYVGIFWEVPEQAIQELLFRVPQTYRLRFNSVCDVLMSEKYSKELCKELLKRVELTEEWQPEILRDLVQKHRPDLEKEFKAAPELLKALIREKADDTKVQLVWEEILGRLWFWTSYCEFCTASLAVIKRLVFELDVPFESLQEMFRMPGGFEQLSDFYPKEVYALYTVAFWQAPERAIRYFLDQLPDGYRLDLEAVTGFGGLKYYSKELRERIADRLEPEYNELWGHLEDQSIELKPGMAKEFKGAPKLLKSLLQQKASDSEIRPVWNSIRNGEYYWTLDSEFCAAPLPMLKTLAFGQDIPISDIQGMFSTQKEPKLWKEWIPEEAYVLYKVMFWEMPEGVIQYFFDRLPIHYKLAYGHVLRFILLPNSSNGLCQQLVARLDLTDEDSILHLMAQIIKFRPDLLE